MPFRRFLTAAAVVLATFAISARAGDGSPRVSGTTYVFVTVDAVTAQGNSIFVTGILKGDAAPSTHSASFYETSGDDAFAALMVSACERKALLAMSKPGQYLLALQDSPGVFMFNSSCTLARVSP
jgi:hypothetical protein